MTFVITSTCLDLKDMSCVEECPVRLHLRGRPQALHPAQGMHRLRRLRAGLPGRRDLPRSAAPGRERRGQGGQQGVLRVILRVVKAPLGAPGGSMRVGNTEADTPRIASLPPNPTSTDDAARDGPRLHGRRRVRDYDAAMDLLADDIEYQNMPLPPVHGKAAVRETTLEALLAMCTARSGSCTGSWPRIARHERAH